MICAKFGLGKICPLDRRKLKLAQDEKQVSNRKAQSAKVSL